jgi:tRNA U34 5-methylaminomethyl-2-thiouridine-forming methyltransferase MnmC
MERKIITTNDGSKTIFIPEWNENYHSKHGALQEALHVFIKSGLQQVDSDHIRVLEIGYGSGLNAILTYIEANGKSKTIHYAGLEAFPISKDEFDALEYGVLSKVSSANDILQKFFDASWEEVVQIEPNFSLQKMMVKLEDFDPKESKYDLIYFDAFGPRVQPEMWTRDILSKMYDTLDSKGIFVTYCAKGQVRRDLKSLGFEVEKIPGPPGKREMLRARKP